MDNKNPHYMTPEEAKQKVCPQSMGGLLMVQDNVMSSEHGCHGPECMAWRWHQKASKAIFYQPHPAKPIPDANWILEKQISETVGLYKEGPSHGYCGMVRP